MTTTTEAERLRAEFRDAAAAAGEIADRDGARWERRAAGLTVALFRAVAAERLDPGEAIRLEHHVIRNHLRFNRPVLRDAEQEAVSLFLTDRRLVSVRCVHQPAQALTADDRDGTVIEELSLRSMAAARPVAERRWGEAIAGVVIAATALLLWGLLAFTGPPLLLLGVAGVAHALVLPTRRLEVEGLGGNPRLVIPAVGCRSGRALARELAALAESGEPTAERVR